ncbi:unannotated protein [freshwater metagenome]|uniref:Unannotated protein n=1 Tax=freshwater metagenome TaxID=449393 RepID=A0A6J7H4V6_9ZZZZ
MSAWFFGAVSFFSSTSRSLESSALNSSKVNEVLIASYVHPQKVAASAMSFLSGFASLHELV